MPLPSRRQGEDKQKFVSRCVSELTKKGEGKDAAQRVAICNSRANLTDSEMSAIANLWMKAQKLITNLTPKLKKKKKDKYRITKKDGSGTDDTTGSCIECISKDDLGSTELYSVAAEKKKSPRPLGKPFRTPGGPKKFSVYVKNDKGNIVKVNFGDPNMEIKRDDPNRRKNFRARHNCDNPGPKWKARYWSCRMWEKGAPVSKIAGAKVCRTSYVNGHVHTVPHYLLEGETSYDHGHTHKFTVEKDGKITIHEAAGHIHEVYGDD